MITAIALLMSSAMFAQQVDNQPTTPVVQQPAKKSDSKRMAILLVPQYSTVNGLRVDMDVKLKRNNRLVIGPQFFVRQNPKGAEYSSMRGVGITIHDKILLNSPFKRQDFYLGYGATYNYSNLSADVYESSSLYTDGYVPYYTHTTNYIYNIHKIGPDVLVGFQFSPVPQLLIDTYLGVAVRYSFEADDKELPSYFTNSILDYGYTGITPLCGVKIGLFL